MRRLIPFFLLLAFVAGASAAPVERIRIEAPVIDPKTDETQRQVADLLDTLAGVANRLYGERFQLARPEAGGAFDYSLSLIASLAPGSPTVVMRITRLSDGTRVSPLPLARPAYSRASIALCPRSLPALERPEGRAPAGLLPPAGGGR